RAVEAVDETVEHLLGVDQRPNLALLAAAGRPGRADIAQVEAGQQVGGLAVVQAGHAIEDLGRGVDPAAIDAHDLQADLPGLVDEHVAVGARRLEDQRDTIKGQSAQALHEVDNLLTLEIQQVEGQPGVGHDGGIKRLLRAVDAHNELAPLEPLVAFLLNPAFPNLRLEFTLGHGSLLVRSILCFCRNTPLTTWRLPLFLPPPSPVPDDRADGTP